LTAQGHPSTIFRRAVEQGNLILAEGMARELGPITLAEALDLTVLVLQKEPGRRSGYTVRWLRRLLEERPQTTIEEAALAASSLAALAGPAHAQAYAVLSGMAETATGGPRRRRVASS
jgi:hypothetical protein